jgi:WD40 repeat protein
MALSSEGASIFAHGFDSCTATVWKLLDYRVLHKLWNIPRFEGSAFSPDGRRLYTISGDSCDVWELDRATYEAVVEPPSSNAAIVSVISYSSVWFYLTSSCDGAMFIHHTTDRQSIMRWRVGSYNTSVFGFLPTAWLPTGCYIASGDPQRGTAVYAVRKSAPPDTPGLAVILLRGIDLIGRRPL